jgi:hypothetical protein
VRRRTSRTITDVPDPVSLFETGWDAVPELAEDGSRGVRFRCPASRVPEMLDMLGFLLDGEATAVDFSAKKAVSSPTGDRDRETPCLDNHGCENG